MHLSDIILKEHTLIAVDGGSKKQVLELIANIAAETSHISSKEVFDALITRERLGSTGIGSGVAIPHARIANLKEPIGCLLILKAPIDFDAQDNALVDIVFGLLVPEEATDAHLQLLAQVAQLLGQEVLRKKMRSAESRDSLYRLLSA